MIWVWQVFDTDEEWGAISADWGIGWVPLYTRREDIAHNGFRELAQAHARATKRPVRLARYELVEVETTF